MGSDLRLYTRGITPAYYVCSRDYLQTWQCLDLQPVRKRESYVVNAPRIGARRARSGMMTSYQVTETCSRTTKEVASPAVVAVCCSCFSPSVLSSAVSTPVSTQRFVVCAIFALLWLNKGHLILILTRRTPSQLPCPHDQQPHNKTLTVMGS